jgi:hypothetical protein
MMSWDHGVTAGPSIVCETIPAIKLTMPVSKLWATGAAKGRRTRLKEGGLVLGSKAVADGRHGLEEEGDLEVQQHP